MSLIDGLAKMTTEMELLLNSGIRDAFVLVSVGAGVTFPCGDDLMKHKQVVKQSNTSFY